MAVLGTVLGADSMVSFRGAFLVVLGADSMANFRVAFPEADSITDERRRTRGLFQ
jgi:hypothetical protein